MVTRDKNGNLVPRVHRLHGQRFSRRVKRVSPGRPSADRGTRGLWERDCKNGERICRSQISSLSLVPEVKWRISAKAIFFPRKAFPGL